VLWFYLLLVVCKSVSYSSSNIFELNCEFFVHTTKQAAQRTAQPQMCGGGVWWWGGPITKLLRFAQQKPNIVCPPLHRPRKTTQSNGGARLLRNFKRHA
jgi:hypothetical protein